MTIRIIENQFAPIPLLMLADPAIDRVQRYLQDGIVFIGEEEDTIIAVAVLCIGDTEAELKNIAVIEEREGQGFGRQLLQHVIHHARAAGLQRIVVGTGNSSLRELAFYQRNGFRIEGVIRGFFDGYHPPIIENEIACRDMIRLGLDLRATDPLRSA